MTPEEIKNYSQIFKDFVYIGGYLFMLCMGVVSFKLHKRTVERLEGITKETAKGLAKNQLVTVTNTTKIDGLDKRVQLLERT